MSDDELLAKAQVIECNGFPIALPHYFFPSWDDLAITAAVEEWKQLPEYVFATRRCKIPTLSADDTVIYILEELGIDSDDKPDFVGVDELQAALDAFREANNGINYFEVDHKSKIKVPDWVFALWRDECRAI